MPKTQLVIYRNITEVIKAINKAMAPIASLKSATEIRTFLAKRGFKGEMDHAAVCPLANYFRAKTGIEECCVNFAINIDLDGYEEPAHVIQIGPVFIKITKSMGDFSRNFDDGKYKELIAE